jgi:hypothetical protein
MRRRNILAISVLFALAFAGLLSFYSPEPFYSGEPLGYWCDQLFFTDRCPGPNPGARLQWCSLSKPASTRQQSVILRNLERCAFEAIDALGTNAVPGLLARLRTKPSRLEAEWIKLQFTFNLRPKSPLTSPIPMLKGDQQRMQALTAIIHLRDPCMIPELNKMTNSSDQWLRSASSYAVSMIQDHPLSVDERLFREVNRELHRRIGNGFAN